jgi:hypothetical protein
MKVQYLHSRKYKLVSMYSSICSPLRSCTLRKYHPHFPVEVLALDDFNDMIVRTRGSGEVLIVDR